MFRQNTGQTGNNVTVIFSKQEFKENKDETETDDEDTCAFVYA